MHRVLDCGIDVLLNDEQHEAEEDSKLNSLTDKPASSHTPRRTGIAQLVGDKWRAQSREVSVGN